MKRGRTTRATATSRPRKRLGQHFLHDPAVVRRIVAAIGPAAHDAMVEIGAGRGALTKPLASHVDRLDVIEIDPRFADELSGIAHTMVHRADALGFDFSALAAERGRLRIVGNLPYNISTPILFRLLDARSAIRDMHLMLQKEVVSRIVAGPGGRDYGRLTVMLSAWIDSEALFDVGPGAFHPAPRVWSTVVRMLVRQQPRFEIGDTRRFAVVVAKAFSMRRKTLGRIFRDEIHSARMEALGIDPRARPETLAPEDFASLAALST